MISNTEQWFFQKHRMAFLIIKAGNYTCILTQLINHFSNQRFIPERIVDILDKTGIPLIHILKSKFQGI